MQLLSLMMIMKLQIMMSKCITIQVIVHQIIENGCITNLVMNMQEITYLTTKKSKFRLEVLYMSDVRELYKRIMKYDSNAIDDIETLSQEKEIIKTILNNIIVGQYNPLDFISINKFIVLNGEENIIVDKKNNDNFIDDLKNAVNIIVDNQVMPEEDVKILMNKKTHNELSLIFKTMPYTNILFNYQVDIVENIKNGELKIEC